MRRLVANWKGSILAALRENLTWEAAEHIHLVYAEACGVVGTPLFREFRGSPRQFENARNVLEHAKVRGIDMFAEDAIEQWQREISRPWHRSEEWLQAHNEAIDRESSQSHETASQGDRE